MAVEDQGQPSGTVVENLLDSFLAYKKGLMRVVGRIVRPEDIEDVVQETFVLSYVASRSNTIHNPKAFMARVARNIALDHVKRAEYRLNCSLEEMESIELCAARIDMPDIRGQSEERFLAFCRAVSELPPGCKRVYILKKVYGLSLDEIAARVGISRSTVEKHVAKGMALVIEYMARNGHAAETTEEDQGFRVPGMVKNFD